MNAKLKWITAVLMAVIATPTLAQEVIGSVKRSSGPVFIERGAERIVAPRGTQIVGGDRLVTGPDGNASLSMRRAVQLNVGPDAYVALDRFASDEAVASKPVPAILKSLASFLAVNRQQ